MLELRLSTQAGSVELICDQSYTAPLQKLRTRYATSRAITSTSIRVGLDEFLVNLRELAAWPDTDVRWQSELLNLVEDNYADSTLVDAALKSTDIVRHRAEVSQGWDAPLTPLQHDSVEHLLALRHGANFSVPGAGKTRVTLATFYCRRELGQANRMLVVSPKSAFEAWVEETAECFPEDLRVDIMVNAVPPECDVLLVNYERLPDAAGALQRWLQAQPALLVLDEAHRMKLGSLGAWGSACYALAPFAAHRIILSGTPAPNGPQDLENLFAFVWPGQGRQSVNRAVTGHTLREASALLKPLFTRVTKAQLDLPPVDVSIRRVPLPPLHRSIYDALVGLSSVGISADSQDFERLGRVMMYLLMGATSPALIAVGSSRHEPLDYRVPPLIPPPGSAMADLMRDLPAFEMSPKFAEALAIVRENAELGRKTIVWSTFVRSLTTLASLMERYAPAVIHGGTEDRASELARFRNDPNCMVLLSNPATLGEGVSLHHVCHEAVYVDRDFAAGRYLQSLDRIHRLGLQPGTHTRVTVLVAEGTIDEVVHLRLESKVEFLLGVLDDPAVEQLTDLNEEPSIAAGMNQSDIAALVHYLRGHVPR